MKTLFLFDGISGSGKSEILKYISEKHEHRVAKIDKFTTRKRRLFESTDSNRTDLVFVDPEDFEAKKHQKGDLLYEYNYGGYCYGFSKAELDNSIASSANEFIFIIIRNLKLIEDLVNEYSEKVIVVPVYIYAARNIIEERLLKDGYDESDIESRLGRYDQIHKEIIKSNLYKETIINDANETDFYRTMESLLKTYGADYEKYNEFYINPRKVYKIVKPLIAYKKYMYQFIAKYPFTANVLVLISLSNNKQSYKWRNIICEELAREGLKSVFPDDEISNITNDNNNPTALTYCCKYAFIIFELDESKLLNNMHFACELGHLYYQEKECLILVHSFSEKAHDRSEEFGMPLAMAKNISRESELIRAIQQWTLKIRRDDAVI
jgi:guanylate kinase